MRTIRVRKGPSSKSPVAAILTTPKYPLRVTQEYENWRQVADNQGEIGWVHKSYLISNGRKYGATLSNCILISQDKQSDIAHLPQGLVVELLQKHDKNWLVIAKDGHGKKMTGLVPCSAIWGE